MDGYMRTTSVERVKWPRSLLVFCGVLGTYLSVFPCDLSIPFDVVHVHVHVPPMQSYQKITSQ